MAETAASRSPSSKIDHPKDVTKCRLPTPRPEEVRELLELVARSLRPVYPLETDGGFDELLRELDQHGL